MNYIRRWYNRNRKLIIKYVIIVAFVIFIIQVVNKIEMNNRNKENFSNTLNSNTNNLENQTGIVVKKDNVIVKDNESLVNGNTVSKTELTSTANIINNFIKYCNSGDITSAYNLLTDECKQVMFPTIEEFKTNYYLSNFKIRKNCEISNWSEKIYKVKLIDDNLETGKISNSYIEDYMTLIDVNGEKKLNINNYIGRTEINNTSEKDGILFSVKYKDSYMDYEEYSIYIKNNTLNTVVMDDLKEINTIYLEDNNEIKYFSYSHEINDNKLIFKSKYSRTVSIKFSNPYSYNRKITNIVFSKVIMNYEEYLNNKNYEKNIIKLGT